MAIYTFDSEVAKVVGERGAVLFQNIAWWCAKNAANGKNIHDGKAWTYNSVKAFAALFDWLTERQVQATLAKLESLELIESGNFNKVSYDRTKWYTVGNAGDKFAKLIVPNWKIHSTVLLNEVDGNVEPIPVVNTDVDTDINQIVKERTPNGVPKKAPEQGFETVEDSKPCTVESSQGSGFNAEPGTGQGIAQPETLLPFPSLPTATEGAEARAGSEPRKTSKGKKEPRRRYGEYQNVLLSDSDMVKLKTEFPNDWQERIERLSGYMESMGKSYKNHLATIRNWARSDKNRFKAPQSRSKAVYEPQGNKRPFGQKEGQTLPQAQAEYYAEIQKQNAERVWTEEEEAAFREMGI